MPPASLRSPSLNSEEPRSLRALFQRSAPRTAPIPEAAVTEVEAVLTRRSVGALSRERVICRDCRRTPLVGEVVHLYGQDTVCELCRPRHRAAPDSSAVVRSPGHADLVRSLR
jgi:hypothetical protein